jgi:hypothetical protein
MKFIVRRVIYRGLTNAKVMTKPIIDEKPAGRHNILV